MKEKITRKRFINKKLRKWKKELEKLLPDEEYESILEEIFTDIKELLC